jgi:glycosyltransferase involved in cell wall biosynthesis
VEIDKFHRADVLSSPLRVLSVGRFVEKKAPYLTILAFAKVLQRLPEARLVMVGGGLLHDVCSKLIKAMHIEHAVELKGILNHEKVAALMQRSRVFVQHSLMPASGDAEGTPVAILEAGAAGLPVVSTKHAGISEVVINAKTGFLVDEGDVDNMAESIYRLLANPELAREMSRNAREHIAVSFNMDQSIERLRILLESCVINGVNGYDVPSQVISDRRPAVSLEK